MFDADEKIVPGRAMRPRDAATLIVVRRRRDGVRILMGRRHEAMAFQPNKFVFPGGGLEMCDQRLGAGGNLRPDVLARAAYGTSLARGRALALAAIRETFEEAAILVGERTDTPPRTRAVAWMKFFKHGVVPRLERLDIVARAVTPPGRVRRFDARFFMVDSDAVALELDRAGSDELLSPTWLSIAQARALDLPGITRRVLDEVEARVLDRSDADRPIPFFRYTRGSAGLSYL